MVPQRVSKHIRSVLMKQTLDQADVSLPNTSRNIGPSKLIETMDVIDPKESIAKDWMYSFVINLIKCTVNIWDLLTYPFYTVVLKPRKILTSSSSPAIDIIKKDKESIVYRSFPVGENVLSIGATLVDLIETAAESYPHRRSLGTRTFLGAEETPEGIKHLQGEYEWLTYKEVNSMSTNFGAGLQKLGFHSGEKVLIFAESSAKWFISAFGSFKNAMTLVTIYTNLGDDGVIHILRQSEARVIITSQGLLERLLRVLPPQESCITTIVVLERETLDPTVHETPGFNIVGFKEVLAEGETCHKEDKPRVNPSDIAVMMYTSGSTGLPKGVLLSHCNIMSNVHGITYFIDQSFKEPQKQRYIGYLPQAHIFELCVEMGFFGQGIPIGFSDPRTLMDISPLVKRGETGDLAVLRPTYMAMVPLVAEKIRKAVLQRVAERGELTKRIFNFCFEYKFKCRSVGQATPLLNALFFRRFKGFLGGELELIASGGAPLSPQVKEFMEIVFDLNLREGYGLTETSGGFIMGGAEHSGTGEVGLPFLGSYVKLVGWEEGGYFPGDQPCPRGEIHVGGNLIAERYYENPTETSQSFYLEEGIRWLQTGDIGQLLPSGSLQIIDRKKDMIKLQNGEYVPLGKVEAHLKTHPLVDSVCAYGESGRNQIIALLIPNMRVTQEFIQQSSTLKKEEDLCKDHTFRRQVERILTEHSSKGLRRFEIPRGFCIVQGPWSPENGLLTSSFKLRRKAIQIKYQNVINDTYNDLQKNALPSKSSKYIL